MSPDELIDFLKENLTIKLEHSWATTYEHAKMTVKILIDDETIAEDTVTIYE